MSKFLHGSHDNSPKFRNYPFSRIVENILSNIPVVQFINSVYKLLQFIKYRTVKPV